MIAPRAALVLFAGIALLISAAEGRGADRIWTALVLATQETPPREVAPELEPFVNGLKTVFGYNSFYLLGDKRKRIGKGTEEWLVPTKEFSLRMRCTDRDAVSYTVALELFLKEGVVVNSEVKLARNAPLYIRGPQWGKGQLIFILEVR